MEVQALLLAWMLTSTSASAADIDVDVLQIVLRYGTVQADLRITNNLPTSVGPIYINCAFLDANRRFIDIGRGLVTAVAPRFRSLYQSSYCDGRADSICQVRDQQSTGVGLILFGKATLSLS